MRRFLTVERGKEKMEADNTARKRPDVVKGQTSAYGFSKAVNSGTVPPPVGASAALTSALSHRDKLLNFQSTSAKRTRVIDQVADFETPESGLSMWFTPQERALQL